MLRGETEAGKVVDACGGLTVALIGDVSGPGVACVTVSVFGAAELAGTVAEDAELAGLAVLPGALDADEGTALPLPQARLYAGLLLKSKSIIPKDGLGVKGAASCRVYHQVLILPRREHATSCQ